MKAPQTREVPKNFGRYEVQGLVGEGSMGRVYKAFDPLARRTVAVKTLKTEYLTSANGNEYLSRFRREAQAAGVLAHPHVITVYDVGENFFVMELLEGLTLQLVLEQRVSLGIDEALSILWPVADALDYAHRKGIVHRDVKPSNIMLLRDGTPKIMDFGVAHLTSSVATAAGEFLGSPSYMAPEQVVTSRASSRSDLFSFAVVAYEMLTGKKAFVGATIAAVVYQVTNVDPPAPSTANSRLPARYDGVFRRALAKDPSVRFPNAQAFVAGLGRRSGDAAKPSSAVFDLPRVPPIHDVETQDIHADPGLREELRFLGRPWARAAIAVFAVGGAILASRGFSARPPPNDTGSLEVTTDPFGARVRIDQADVGRAPVRLASLKPGRHDVQVELEGFNPAELTLSLPAGQAATPLRFTLRPAAAILDFASTPPGAAVRVDGQVLGASPVQGFKLNAGSHTLEVRLAGYRPWSQTFQAVAGTKVPIAVSLQREVSPSERASRLKSEGWVKDGDVVPLEPGMVPPKLISGAPAPYPESAKALELRGHVAVEMIVTSKGEPTELRVVDSAGETLDEAVLAAVRNWRYSPAEKNGVKVGVPIRVEQDFPAS